MKDVEGFAKAIKKLLNMEKEQIAAMSKNAREKAEMECDADKINAFICDIVKGKDE